MTVVITRRGKLPWSLGLQPGIAAPRRVEPLRTDDLLIALRRRERFARRTFAVPAGNLLVAELAALPAIPVGAGAIGEALVLGPDSRVDDADDDALARVLDTTGVIPQSAELVQSEERWC